VVHDTLSRPLASLRLSLTDRCNLRCRYCMPEEEYVWLPRSSILSFEEIQRLAGIFAGLGVTKVRLTGGEPLLRHDVPLLVALLAREPRIADLALTTNGMLLAAQARDLRGAGLQRVTVSLDTLRPERFEAYTRSKRHADVLAGIAAARAAGFRPLKVNTVVVRGYNEDELADLIEFGRAHDAEIRFIEYMDVGGATRWSLDQVVSRREMLDALGRRYGARRPRRGVRPARRHALRHHRFDDGPLLPRLRPEPRHGRRDVVPLPLRRAGHQPAGSAALGCDRRGHRGTDRRHVDRQARPGRRGTARGGGPGHPLQRAVTAGRSAQGDAHAGRVRSEREEQRREKAK